MQQAAAKAIDWSEQGLVPDAMIRHGIKRLRKKRLAGLRRWLIKKPNSSAT